MDKYEINVLTRKGGWKKLSQEVNSGVNDSLINALTSAGHKDVRAYNDVELKNLIEKKLNIGDIVVFLGAGDISSKAKLFVEKMLI